MKNYENYKTKIILSAICFALYSFLGSGALIPMGIAYSFYSIARIPFLLLSIFCVITIFKNKPVLLTIPLCLLSMLYAIVFLMIVYFMITDFAVEGFLYLFASLIQVGIYVVMVIHSLKNSTISPQNERLWTIPVILQIVSIFFSLYALTHGNIRSVNLISEILLCVGLVFLGMYMNENNISIDMEKDTTVSSLAGYCDLVKHILLLIFTFGIWQYVWIYRTTDFLNTTPNEEKQNPTNKLLLCMFVPFYYIYWIYKNAKRIDNLALSKGKESDIGTACLILALFIPIIPPILMQDKINKVVKFSGNNNVYYGAPSKPHIDTLGTADEIKKYKELLDMGIITEEEFNAKKKQLLGL